MGVDGGVVAHRHHPIPQRSSPPDLGGELGAVVPALGTLVRARNDCFIALDLDPGNFRLPLFAALLTALEQAHGHSPFGWGAGERPAPWVDGVPRNTSRGASRDLQRCEF